jgi:hypothetical protein
MDILPKKVVGLTNEAEHGLGHAVRIELDGMSFQDRIRTLRKMEKLSASRHCVDPNRPYLTYEVQINKEIGYACLELERHAPHQGLFGLMDQTNTIYSDFLDLYDGDEAKMDADIISGHARPSLR